LGLSSAGFSQSVVPVGTPAPDIQPYPAKRAPDPPGGPSISPRLRQWQKDRAAGSPSAEAKPASAARAEAKPTAPAPPSIEDLQKQLADQDAQILNLKYDLQQAAAHLAALSKLYAGCYEVLSADEAKAAKK